MAIDAMTLVNRNNYNNKDLNLLTSFEWDFEILNYQDTVMYMPPLDTTRTRVKSIAGVPELPEQGSLLTADIRGFTILQPGMNTTKPPALTLAAQDFEDQALKVWLYDWVLKCDSLKTHAGYRRKELMIDIQIWRYNTARQPVWTWYYENCLPSGNSYTGSMTSEKSAIGETTIGIQGEAYTPTPLNIN